MPADEPFRNGDPKTYELVFDESRRALTRQEASVDELRSRTSALLAAQALVSSFLGSVALNDSQVGPFGYVAFAGFLAGGLLALAILWPTTKTWIFSMDVHLLLDGFVEAKDEPATIDELHRELAIQGDGWIEENDRHLSRLYWLYRGIAIAVVVQVLFWLFELGQTPLPQLTP